MALVGLTGNLFSNTLATQAVSAGGIKLALEQNANLIRDKKRQQRMIRDLAQPDEAFKDYEKAVKKVIDDYSILLNKEYVRLTEEGYSPNDALNMATEAITPSYENSLKIVKGLHPLATDTETLINAAIGNRVNRPNKGLKSTAPRII